MPKNSLSMKVAGEAGQGVESGGAGFAKALVRGGLYIFGLQDYMSRIRGGHNFFQVRVSERPIQTFDDEVHLLLAFNKNAVEYHAQEVSRGGGILHDAAIKVDAAMLEERGVHDFELPLIKIAEEHGGHRIMMNTAALGATAGITDFEFERIADIIETNFKRKGAETVNKNLTVARTAYDMANDKFGGDFEWKLQSIPGAPQRMIMNGNQALAMGALAAGCRFISTYPMTPASTITEWLAAHSKEFGIVQKQTEDETAAILFAIGAAHAGVRAMTASSGGGFCLMVEAYGLAAMTETPLVIAEVQRGGPSTGLPTRTESSDLDFVLSASHGEFPRFVIAPGSVEQCFEAGHRAFNLAEKYQTPIIILSDLFLSNAQRTVEMDAIDFSKVSIDRGETLEWEDLDKLVQPYERHLLTDDGVSPRAAPGHPNAVYITTGDEHNHEGFITEDGEIRNQQMEKRMRKAERASREDMRMPYRFGPPEADVTLVTFGSTVGAAIEAAERLTADGIPANVLQFVDMSPLDEDRLTDNLNAARRLIAVEQNYTGQLAGLIRRLTGRKVDGSIRKYDGRPFSPTEITTKVRQEVLVHV